MRLAVILVLAACGRIGFDDAPSTDGNGSGGTGVALCDPRTVSTLALVGNAIKVRAIRTELGYVVAIGTDAGNVYFARVPSSLDSAALHLPLAANYALTGLGVLSEAVFVHTVSGGAGFLKLLDPTFDTYTTVENTDSAAIDPPIAARANGRGWRVTRLNGVLDVADMDRAGNKSGLQASYAAPGTTGTIDGNRVVYELGAVCESFLVDELGAIGELHRRSSCSEPRVTVLRDGRGMMVHRSASSQVHVYSIPADASQIGLERSLGEVSEPRIVAIDNFAWLMWRSASGVVLGRFDSELVASTANVPEVKAPYDLTTSAVFWVEDSALRVATPCLR